MTAAACETRRQMDELGNAIGVLAPEVEGSVVPHDDSSRARLERIARIEARGAMRIGEPRAFDPQTDRAGLAIELDLPACYTLVVALEDPASSATLRLEDAQGRLVVDAPVGQSVQAGGPFCVADAGTVTLRLDGADGRAAQAGTVAVYRHTDPVLAEVLERIAQRVATVAAGATPRGPVLRDAIEQGRSIEVPIVLAPGECRLVAAAAEGSGADFDLELLDGGGAVLLRDIGVDRDPIVGPFCAAEARVLRMRLRAYSRTGVLYWRSWTTLDGTVLPPPASAPAVR